MGQRVRLKESFVIPDHWTIFEKAVLRGLKKYGALVADNGNFFSISVTPDNRYPADAFSHLSSISITNFEVVETTGMNEGPRSPGGPIVEAGTNLTASPSTPITLSGSVSISTGIGPVTTEWTLYSGPGAVTIQDRLSTNTTATFEKSGDYILMLKATDDLHTPSYDTVRVHVTDGFTVSVERDSNALKIAWTGIPGTYIVESTDGLAHEWTTTEVVTGTEYLVPPQDGQRFFRVRRE